MTHEQVDAFSFNNATRQQVDVYPPAITILKHVHYIKIRGMIAASQAHELFMTYILLRYDIIVLYLCDALYTYVNNMHHTRTGMDVFSLSLYVNMYKHSGLSGW